MFGKSKKELVKELQKEKMINTRLSRENEGLKNKLNSFEKELNKFKYEEDLKYLRLKEELKIVVKDNINLKNKLSNINEKLNNMKLKPREQQITTEDIKRIKDLKKQGLTYRKIANEVNWSICTISKVVNGVYDKTEKILNQKSI